MSGGWTGVDLDGTLAYYEQGYARRNYIGPPVPVMLARVQNWLAEGRRVRIFTARVAEEDALLPSGVTHFRAEMYGDAGDLVVCQYIWQWCVAHDLPRLPITCRKDRFMVEFWDDRCVQVISNTGRTLIAELTALRGAS